MSETKDHPVAITRPVWLFLLREGGCWTTAAIVRALRLDRQCVYPTMSQMADRRMVKRHVPTEWGKPLAYEVDDDCRIPDGMTLKDLREAGFGAIGHQASS